MSKNWANTSVTGNFGKMDLQSTLKSPAIVTRATNSVCSSSNLSGEKFSVILVILLSSVKA